jgi:hypothetical protein
MSPIDIPALLVSLHSRSWGFGRLTTKLQLLDLHLHILSYPLHLTLIHVIPQISLRPAGVPSGLLRMRLRSCIPSLCSSMFLGVSIYHVERRKRGYGLTGTCGLYLVPLILLSSA